MSAYQSKGTQVRGKHARHAANNDAQELTPEEGESEGSFDKGFTNGAKAPDIAVPDMTFDESTATGKESAGLVVNGGTPADMPLGDFDDEADKALFAVMDDEIARAKKEEAAPEFVQVDGLGQESQADEQEVVLPPLPTIDQNEASSYSKIPGQNYPTGFVSAMPEGVTLHKKHDARKVVGMTFGIVIGVLLIAYIAGAVVFMNMFFPRTTVGGLDVSMKSNADAAKLIQDKVDNYTLDVEGGLYTFTTTGSDIDLSVDTDSVINAMHAELNPWAWPIKLVEGAHDVTDQLKVTYDRLDYDADVVRTVKAFNSTATPPENATIVYDGATKSYVVKKEVQGTQYDSHAILAAIDDCVNALEPKLTLTNDYLIQPTVFSTDEKLIESAELATGLVSADVTLVMAGLPVWEITGDALSQYVRMDANSNVTLDEAALNEWVKNLANSFDTVGSERSYTRADGKGIVVRGGVYGWSTDSTGLEEQVMAAIKAGQTVSIDIPCEQAAAVYNGPGQRDWGTRYVDVDLSEQYVRFYGDDGGIIWEAPCISGSPDGKHNTVEGVWYVNNKESPSKLIGYDNGVKEYETMVTYWMAFESSAIGFHDATWQPSFGGSMYANGYGSHGCVNLSYGDAESLYGIINIGDVVVVHS